MQVEDKKLVDEEVVDDVDGTEDVVDDVAEFEYDEDGNIVIPEVEEDDDADEKADETDQDDDDDTDHESQDKDADKSQDTTKEAQNNEPETKQPDEKDKKIAELEKQSAAKDSLIRDALKALGVEQTDNPTDGLERFLAETSGQSLEEYRKGKDEAAKVEEARQLLQRTEFEKVMKADLDEIHRNFPDTQNITDILKIENVQKFAELRDKGLSATEAYAAANISSIKRSVATSVKQQSLNETKSHLQSAVPKSAKDTSTPMSQKDLNYWREMFPNKTEKEIRELHQQVSKKYQ